MDKTGSECMRKILSKNTKQAPFAISCRKEEYFPSITLLVGGVFLLLFFKLYAINMWKPGQAEDTSVYEYKPWECFIEFSPKLVFG